MGTTFCFAISVVHREAACFWDSIINNPGPLFEILTNRRRRTVLDVPAVPASILRFEIAQRWKDVCMYAQSLCLSGVDKPPRPASNWRPRPTLSTYTDRTAPCVCMSAPAPQADVQRSVSSVIWCEILGRALLRTCRLTWCLWAGLFSAVYMLSV